MFLLFRQGFTRFDRAHYNQFLCLFPLVLYCLYAITPLHKKMWGFLTVASLAGSLVLSAFVYFKNYSGNIPLFSGPAPLKTYFTQLFKGSQKAVIHPAPGDGGSYDYYSNQCIIQKSNGNPNWHNRPAFQSIVAVSPYLDSLNAAYYSGGAAPDTIFYDNLTTDNRNPLWEDPQCKWVMLANYRYRYTDSLRQLVLTRRIVPLSVSHLLLSDTIVRPGQAIHVPRVEKGIVTISAHVDNTVLGSLRALVFQPPHIDLVLKKPGDSIIGAFRYIVPLYNDRKLLLSYSLPGMAESVLGYQNQLSRDLFLDFNSIKPNVESFLFQTDMPAGVKSGIRVRLYATTME